MSKIADTLRDALSEILEEPGLEIPEKLRKAGIEACAAHERLEAEEDREGRMNGFTFDDIEVVSKDGKIKLVLEWIGEGMDGDYRPNDPEDYPHLRFSLYRKEFDEDLKRERWDEVDDVSHCTMLDGRLPRNQLEGAAKYLLAELEGCHHVKRRGDELSWIDRSWLEKIAGADTNADDLDDEEEEEGDFSTTCPYCKEKGCLEVAHFSVTTDIPLHSDGFSTNDASYFDTSDEIVHCRKCDKEFPLSEVTL